MSPPSIDDLFASASRGDGRAVGRLISLVEAGGEQERAVSARAFAGSGSAWVVGVTGSPGVGKSTLVDALVACARTAGQRIAVVAVDPSSPVSRGAILGDRVRMQRHATDPGVYVRSMASRGQQGGLAQATLGAVRVLDAAGWPWIVVETVGAGQADVDVAQAADTVLVAVAPGWGDSLQAAKAGLVEVADGFVVNQADRPGADGVMRDLEQMLDLSAWPGGSWRPPVVRTVGTTGEGVDRVWDMVERHRRHLGSGDRLAARRADRLAAEVRRLVREAAARAVTDHCRGPAYEQLVSEVAERRLDPVAAADALMEAYARSTPRARPQARQ